MAWNLVNTMARHRATAAASMAPYASRDASPPAPDAYTQEDVRDAVVDFVRRRAGQCGIVYCMTQADAEACADHLTTN